MSIINMLDKINIRPKQKEEVKTFCGNVKDLSPYDPIYRSTMGNLLNQSGVSQKAGWGF